MKVFRFDALSGEIGPYNYRCTQRKASRGSNGVRLNAARLGVMRRVAEFPEHRTSCRENAFKSSVIRAPRLNLLNWLCIAYISDSVVFTARDK